MTHHSHNEFHLGDNLIHLHFLRKLALRYPEEQFRHAVQPCHLKQLGEAIADVPNVQLIPYEDKPLASVNVWKNAGATITTKAEGRMQNAERYVPGFWEQHKFRNNYAWFYIEWFEHLARGMGLENPIKTYKDLWFDYPKIQRGSERVKKCLEAVAKTKSWWERPATGLVSPHQRFDFLIVNSRPCSGQFRAYDSTEYLTPLIAQLAADNSVVITQPLFIDDRFEGIECPEAVRDQVVCTHDYDLTISEIGTLSLHADHLIMVSTGPSWPTFNVWNENAVKLRLLLIDCPERIDYAPNLVQVATREAAREILQQRGLL